MVVRTIFCQPESGSACTVGPPAAVALADKELAGQGWHQGGSGEAGISGDDRVATQPEDEVEMIPSLLDQTREISQIFVEYLPRT